MEIEFFQYIDNLGVGGILLLFLYREWMVRNKQKEFDIVDMSKKINENNDGIKEITEQMEELSSNGLNPALEETTKTNTIVLQRLSVVDESMAKNLEKVTDLIQHHMVLEERNMLLIEQIHNKVTQ